MPVQSNRHLRKQIDSGKCELPEELSFLGRSKYTAIFQQKVGGTREWFVEVQGSWLKSLLATKKKLLEARSTIRTLLAEKQEIEVELQALRKLNADLRSNNERLLQNIEADQTPDSFPRSPKNYLAVAEERGTKFGTPPLQGGLAGLEKK